MKGRSWAALHGTCYYPIDLEQPVGTRIAISRSGAGRSHYGRITVEAVDYGTEDITLPDNPPGKSFRGRSTPRWARSCKVGQNL